MNLRCMEYSFWLSDCIRKEIIYLKSFESTLRFHFCILFRQHSPLIKKKMNRKNTLIFIYFSVVYVRLHVIFFL